MTRPTARHHYTASVHNGASLRADIRLRMIPGNMHDQNTRERDGRGDRQGAPPTTAHAAPGERNPRQVATDKHNDRDAEKKNEQRTRKEKINAKKQMNKQKADDTAGDNEYMGWLSVF